MAAYNIWNPNPAEQYDLDPETGQYRPRPPGTPQAPPAPGYDIDAFYQRTLGRAPDANERSTDLANIERYGAAGFESDFQKRLAPSGGGQASQAPQYQTPAQQWNAQPSANAGRSDEFFKVLMNRATQGTAVNRNDPNIRAQVDPLTAQMERSSRNYIDDVAERAGPLANIQGERRLAAERTGQAAGQLEAEVIGREISARRDEIAQALMLYGSQLSNEQRLEMERELAQLNAQLQREGFGLRRDEMGLQNDQFLRELALREWMAGDQSDRAWAGFGG